MIGRKFCWGWRKRTNANSALKKSSQARVREDSQANKARKVFCGWQVHHHFWMRSQARIRDKRCAFEIWAMRRVWEGLMTRLDGSSRFANRRRSRISFGVKVCTVAQLPCGFDPRFGLKTVMVYLSNYDSCLKTPNSEQPIAIEKESMRSVWRSFQSARTHK